MKKENITKAFVSFVVVVVFSLQFFATFRLCNYLPRFVSFLPYQNFTSYCAPKMWPFLTYPMYKYAHYEGDEIVEYEAYAVFKDSTEVNVLPKDVNIGFWRFRWDFVPAIRKNNRSRIKDYVSLIKERYKRKPVGLRLEVHPWIVQKKGAVEASPEVLAKVRIATDSTRR
jgi:hypothetical protein